MLHSGGYSIGGTAAQIMKRGRNGCLQKPFNLPELFHKDGVVND
jgi:hypothetical protein